MVLDSDKTNLFTSEVLIEATLLDFIDPVGTQ